MKERGSKRKKSWKELARMRNWYKRSVRPLPGQLSLFSCHEGKFSQEGKVYSHADEESPDGCNKRSKTS